MKLIKFVIIKPICDKTTVAKRRKTVYSKLFFIAYDVESSKLTF